MCFLISENQPQGTCIWFVIVGGPKCKGTLSYIGSHLWELEYTRGQSHAQSGRWSGGDDVEPSRNGECRRWPFGIQAELGYYVPNRVFGGSSHMHCCCHFRPCVEFSSVWSSLRCLPGSIPAFQRELHMLTTLS